MKCVKAELPDSWKQCNVYAISDLHIGDQQTLIDEVHNRINMAKNDPNGVILLNGDLCDTATIASVSDTYTAKMTPMQQMQYVVELLRPVKHKIIGVCTGNHEDRVTKAESIDMTRVICTELGIQDKYSHESLYIFLRFGRKTGSGTHRYRENDKQLYAIYMTHGTGGGRRQGGKINRLVDLAGIVDADIYIMGHTHMPAITRNAFYRTHPQSSVVSKVEHLFVNTAACMEYGGYGEKANFKPSSIFNPVIHLSAECKRMTATL